MTVKRIKHVALKAKYIVDFIITKLNVQKINDFTSYALVVLLWAPHGAKECIRAADFSCKADSPNFVAPMIFTFLAPNWVMDMSSSGWGTQILFAPPVLLLMYLVVRFSKKGLYGKILQISAVRWGLMWTGIMAYYNYVFWYGPLREYVFPFFVFTSDVFK